ncbi:MAG: motility associated factor glycosyltransferase family protein, partial [Candidatus Gastranaerophilales bacterium]|nr:motility associated factor glycosyltransferase family protein [Candidatus Gastranaerophilales bacterium]
MTKSLLDKNLECISRYNRELAQKIANITELKGNYEIKNAKSGDSVLYKDGLPLDDTVDPVWRAMEDYKKIKFKIKRSITFILGFGLGYALKEFAKKHAGKIIIYEPDINTLRIVFEIVDYSEELQKNNIRIVSDYKELENAYHAFFFVEHRLNVMCSDYYFDNHSATTLEIKKKLEDLHSIFQSNYN